MLFRFFVSTNEVYEFKDFQNVSSFAVSYNTEADCNGAEQYDERRWNYAFWRQNETPVIDPDEPNELLALLYDWYEEMGIKNVGEEDANCYDENSRYIGKGPAGHYELLSLVADLANRLQMEGFAELKFGKRIPIIVHGLEYTWYDIEATKKANPNGEADAFIKAMENLGLI